MNKQEEVKFTQSGFLKIDGKKRVSVRFERGSDIAEGMLPPGKIFLFIMNRSRKY